MKKRAQKFDFETAYKFLDLPQNEIETACIYEYMRESQALRDLNDQEEPAITPYLNRLSLSCKKEHWREYRLQKAKAAYRIHCSRCNQGVDLPFIAGGHWERQFEKEYRRVGRARPSFAQEFGWYATLRLVQALRNAGFPNPWKVLSKSAREELIPAITGWEEERKKIYPPVAIEPALERDLEREQEHGARFPVWRIKSFEPELRRRRRSRRKYFCGLIWIDEGYNETEAAKAFKTWFSERYPQTKGGGAPNWRARLKWLAVMRIWKHESDQWKRLKLVAEFCRYKDCVREWAAYKERRKTAHANEPMSSGAKVEMSSARGEARTFFQSLFPGEEPLSY